MNDSRKSPFLDEQRLIDGPWQSFERDVARLFLSVGFEDVKVVGGTGDRGADILGFREDKLWVCQCKFTSRSNPPKEAVDEVVEAGRFYKADRLVVAMSRPPGEAVRTQKAKYERQGLKIDLATPLELLKMVRNAPEYCKNRRKLRPYQADAAQAFRNGLLETGRAQAVLATGLGKTVIMADVVSDLYTDNRIPSGRTLVLAHTRELVDQLQRSFWPQLPKWVPTQRLADGEVPTSFEGITFATVQSVVSRQNDLPTFDLVLIDEAHHIGSPTFKAAVQLLQPSMLGGVTATPWRGDGYDIDELLGPALVRIGIAEGLRDGFLSEVEYRLMADNLDWELVQSKSSNRYSLSHLNRKLIIPTRDEEAARIILDSFQGGRVSAIVFSPTIAHSYEMASMLRRYDLRAEAIHGELPPRERHSLLTRFRSREIDILTTVDLFNEGIDVPDVDLIVFMRATHSRRIFVQQLGRGLRVSPRKSNVLVLDFVSDLRRIAEVLDLDAAVKGGELERVGLGDHIIQFHDASAGSFLREWMLDQASLLLREADPTLEIPTYSVPVYEFPDPIPPGGVQ